MARSGTLGWGVGQQHGCPLALGSTLTRAVQLRLSVDASCARHGKAAVATSHTRPRSPRRQASGIRTARAPPRLARSAALRSWRHFFRPHRGRGIREFRRTCRHLATRSAWRLQRGANHSSLVRPSAEVPPFKAPFRGGKEYERTRYAQRRRDRTGRRGPAQRAPILLPQDQQDEGPDR